MSTSKNTRQMSGVFLLISGSILIMVSFMRFSVEELGWVVYAPLFVFIYERSALKQHFALCATFVMAYLLTVSKMVTSEIPWTPVPMFAIPMAFSTLVSISVAGLVYSRAGVRWGVGTFASMTTALGWIQYSFTPSVGWGILENTQINNLPLIQLGTLNGLEGITFLVALGSGLIATVWSSGIATVRKDIVFFGAILFGVLMYGQLRLSKMAPGKMICKGGVVSPITYNEFHSAHENTDALRSLDNELFARTERAALLGAKGVVWNEVARVVPVAGEEALVMRGQAFAKEKGVFLLMAYAVATSVYPFYIYKDSVYLPEGTMADEYIKRKPAPGDPHDAGFAHAKDISFEGIYFSRGICYDYSFPVIARDNANDGFVVTFIPASDCRGIDHGYGRMDRMSIVPAGLPMMRPMRASESIACNQYGRVLGSLPWGGSGDGVFVVAMCGARLPTGYAKSGEALPLLSLAFCEDSAFT